MNHTPGPWEAYKSGIYHKANHGICIAARHPQAGEEYPANARLIAAAPELLAACLMIDLEDDETVYVLGTDATRAISAAIAKATEEAAAPERPG